MKRKSTTATFDEDTPITQAEIDAGKLILRKVTIGSNVTLGSHSTVMPGCVIGDRAIIAWRVSGATKRLLMKLSLVRWPRPTSKRRYVK